MIKASRVAVAVLAASTLIATGISPVQAADKAAAGASASDRLTSNVPLRAVAPPDLRIGTAVAGGGHHLEQEYPDPFTYDRPYRRVLAHEFNSASP